MRPPPDVESYARGVRRGDRAAVARAITLVESGRAADREPARRLIESLAGDSVRACRIGVTGVPGAGKSTLIETLGAHLIDNGHRVGVLAVDPSSVRTGGSILADRVRMHRLGDDPAAYVRPSPSRGALGGVTATTDDVITVLEAAGFDVVLVETVGVGQSETEVAELVDVVLLLTLAGAGDAMQGIKMGVLEIADVVVVNKADGANEAAARAAAAELTGALRLFPGGSRARVLTCSARTGDGIAELWDRLHERALVHSSAADRHAMTRAWRLARGLLLDEFTQDPAVRAAAEALAAELSGGTTSAGVAARRLRAAYRPCPGASGESRPGFDVENGHTAPSPV
ncbi:methylmalonyl Co-A mutase-associated GTPase MeaB [Actinoplanes sp. NPDC023801]|uniref:methylmalonyl Co-A mutase-associated GTPase MeaB n=1 Tax=Actinoplanes sp. NPDC023801 TaxID=3154595 RepID=UPI0033F9A551